jgi:hypothetical protein
VHRDLRATAAEGLSSLHFSIGFGDVNSDLKESMVRCFSIVLWRISSRWKFFFKGDVVTALLVRRCGFNFGQESGFIFLSSRDDVEAGCRTNQPDVSSCVKVAGTLVFDLMLYYCAVCDVPARDVY